jgi:hypothetical protein
MVFTELRLMLAREAPVEGSSGSCTICNFSPWENSTPPRQCARESYLLGTPWKTVRYRSLLETLLQLLASHRPTHGLLVDSRPPTFCSEFRYEDGYLIIHSILKCNGRGDEVAHFEPDFFAKGTEYCPF